MKPADVGTAARPGRYHASFCDLLHRQMCQCEVFFPCKSQQYFTSAVAHVAFSLGSFGELMALPEEKQIIKRRVYFEVG